MKDIVMGVNLIFMQIIKALWQQAYIPFMCGTVILFMMFFIFHIISNTGSDPIYRVILKICKGNRAKTIASLIVLVVLCSVFFPMWIVIVAIYICDLNNRVINWCKHKAQHDKHNKIYRDNE